MSGQQDLFRRLLAEKTDAARRPPAPSRFGSGHRSRGDDDGPPEEREGTIESVIHQSEDDFRVIRVRVGSSSEVWRGKMPAVAKGQPVIGTGRAVDHPQHGPQFVVIDVHAKLPSSKEGVRHFLLGLGVKGLGPKKIDAAVEQFGEGVKDALDQPLLLATVRGINADLANRTTEAWQAEKASRAEVMKLEEYGIRGELIHGLTRRTGNLSACSVPHALRETWARLTGVIACPTAAVGSPGRPEVLQGCVLLRSTPHHDRQATVAA